MKKLISITLIIMLIVSMLNVPVYAVTFSGLGAGTSGDPYQITTWAQLNEIRNHLSSYFKLMNDIDGTAGGYSTYASSSANGGSGWEPIGSFDAKFTGKFDGNGYSISGLNINRPSDSHLGLFGYVSTAEISSVKLRNVNIKGKGNIGGLAGWAENTTIRKSSVTGTVEGIQTSGGSNIGGLVGYQYYGEITICYANASVSGYSAVGGLVGYNNRGNINNSYALGNVHGYLNQLGDKFPGGEGGGLVGAMAGSNESIKATIDKCYATGTVTGTINFKGVLVGFMLHHSSITNSFFDTTIYSFPSWFGNGGKPDPYYDVSIDITRETTTNMHKKTTFTSKGWDFNEIWTIDEGSSYPYFKEQIKVSFNLNYTGGTAPSDIYYKPDPTLKYGSESKFPDNSAMTRAGYTFEGWYTKAKDGTKVTSSSSINAENDHILYAKWIGDSITVDFDANGGSETPSPSTISATVGAIYGELPTTPGSITGYTFDGWESTTTGGIKVTSASTINIPNSHTLYAKWMGNQYTVSFDTNSNGEVPAPVQKAVTYGSAYGTLPQYGITTIGGIIYWFEGWYTGASTEEGVLVTTNTSVTTATDHAIYAHWSVATTNAITYNGNGHTSGTAIDSESFYPGTTVTVIGAGILEKTGYTFAGWNSKADGTGNSYAAASTLIMQNKALTLYAVWQPNDVHVSFDTQTVEVTTPNSINVKYDRKYEDNSTFKNTIQKLTRIGYDLLGWFKELVDGDDSTANKVTDVTIVNNTNPHTLFAKWTPKKFKLTYDSQGGTITGGASDVKVTYDSEYGQLKDATRQGYALDGWYTATSGGIKIESTSKVAITTAQALYARWTPNTDTPYTAGHYKQNVVGDGYTPITHETRTGTTAAIVSIGEASQPPAGFTENLAKRVTSGAIAGDGSLALGYYYDRNVYNVTFNNNGGTGVTLVAIRHDGTIAHLAQPTRPGYYFGGWYEDAGLTDAWNINNDKVTTATTLYAKWYENSSNDDDVYQPSTEQINVNVETGALGQEVVNKTPITRTTGADGKKNDKVTFTPESAKEAIKSIKDMGQNIARVVITDPKDEVASIDFTLPKDTHKQISDAKVNFEIYTENAKLIIPPSSLSSLDKDLYFRFVPIKEEPLRKEVEERARVEKIVIQIAEGQKVNVVTRPMTIETNMQNKAVTLVFPLKDVVLPTNTVEREKYLSDLVIFIEHSDGEKELVKPQVLEYSAGMPGLQFGVNKFSTFTILNMEGYYAYLQTQAKHHKSYIKGYVDGTFKPEQSITRAEMAAILARNLNFDEAKTVLSSYPDLQATHWALREIEFVKTTGLMTGDAKGTFRPDSPISRGEMAAIAARYKKLATTSFTTSSFIDVEASYWGAAEIEAVRTIGIVEGYLDNTYKPHNSLSRAEAVKIVNRLFERGPLYGTSIPSWPDVQNIHWSYMEVEEASKSHNYLPRQVGGEDVIYLNNN